MAPEIRNRSDVTAPAPAPMSRRAALGRIAAAAGLGPWVLRQARASSGELEIMMWSDYLPAELIDGFRAKTGIVVRHGRYGSNEELLNRVSAMKGRGVDIVGPTSLRAPQWRPLGLLRPWDLGRVPTGRVAPAMLERSTDAWTWDGGVHHLPFFWGTEALGWNTDDWSISLAGLSYGDLWRPELEGRIMGRPHSMMLTIGLWLDATGKLPSNRMLDAYKDEATMRRIWSAITRFAVANKAQVKQFWNDSDTQTTGFLNNAVVLGQVWNGPALRLRGAGRPIAYMAPREGALAWMDGVSLAVGARNIDQAYAFLDYVYTPGVAAMLSDRTGYHPVVSEADRLLRAETRRRFAEAYPGDALDRLWWWPEEPIWYASARAEFRDRFVVA